MTILAAHRGGFCGSRPSMRYLIVAKFLPSVNPLAAGLAGPLEPLVSGDLLLIAIVAALITYVGTPISACSAFFAALR